MANSTFQYVTYIRSTPEKVWRALTDAEIIKQWWFGVVCESDWQVGSHWKMLSGAGMLYDSGEVLEHTPQKRLAINWRNEWMPEFKAEGESHCTYDLEPVGQAVQLTVTHSMRAMAGRTNSKFIASISEAWPMTLSNLKSLLETGAVALADNPRHIADNPRHA